MKINLKMSMLWLVLGPFLALLVSLPSWYVFNNITPDKLTGMAEMISIYPQVLLMSLLTPWGWLMYGGFVLMSGVKFRAGLVCTVLGAVLLGLFLPIWSTHIVST